MSRSFLKGEALAGLRADFLPPSFPIDGAFRGKESWPSTAFSQRLLETLLRDWRRDPNFAAAGPVLVGSGARDELCPRSDFDVLFAGDERAVAAFVRAQQERGVRLRSRVPEDPADWGRGVDVPDWLALLEAQALTPLAEARLDEQREMIRRRLRKERRLWLRRLAVERADREKRFDSIANVLEPNLKYGPGGLRDLDQARQVLRLFPERFEGEDEHAAALFETYAGLWTTIRQKLHLEGQGDLLSSAAQFDVAAWFGLSHRDFMREVQRGLSRVHFYSTWVFERARASRKRLESLEETSLRSRRRALDLLRRDPSVLAQQRVRRDLDQLFPPSWVRVASPERGRLLWDILKPKTEEAVLVAAFNSRLIDKLCPEIRPLVGLVQHDQYHRYTADVHLQQACREWQRTLAHPRRLGVMASEVRALSTLDQRVLSWTALYHDLMKGREGDHSLLGRQLVRKELGGFGVPAAVIAEVEWMVEHHLEVSQAAFRRNPLSPTTWARLEEIGATGDRLRRLAVFTCVDILATNAEAWTPWKARLIHDLLKALRSKGARDYLGFRRHLEKAGVALDAEAVDGFLLSRLGPKAIAADLGSLQRLDRAAPLVVAPKGRGVWVRFHEREDRPGLFADFVQRLYSLGLGIRHASVHTLPGVGVYDWFEIASRKSPAQIRAWLAGSNGAAKPPPEVRFDKVSLVSQDQSEWVLSFKGLDQPGCLGAAARALADQGISLKAARVHTWGRQIDDVFTVEPKGDPQALLAVLRTKFLAEG